MKTIIAIFGWENRGKSSAIKAVAHRWGLKEDDSYDVFGELNSVGFVGEGDPGSDQGDKIEKLMKSACECIVCASRTKGSTTDNVSNLAAKYGYRVLWTSNYSIDYGSLGILGVSEEEMENQGRQMNNLFADAMMVLIHRVLKG